MYRPPHSTIPQSHVKYRRIMILIAVEKLTWTDVSTVLFGSPKIVRSGRIIQALAIAESLRL
jgi:hypothetical protein